MLNIQRIRALSKERGVSMNFLCSKIGVNNHYFLDVAKKNIPVPEERILAIADTLSTTIEYLTDETDDPTPKQKSPTSWRDMDMSIEKRNFFEELDKLSDEQILSLSRIMFPIIDEIKANRKERQ